MIIDLFPRFFARVAFCMGVLLITYQHIFSICYYKRNVKKKFKYN